MSIFGISLIGSDRTGESKTQVTGQVRSGQVAGQVRSGQGNRKNIFLPRKLTIFTIP